MSLSAGQSLAHYEILELIGKGGMGEVYRARDKKLGRDVAIKVLPQAFSEDAERFERLKREAQLLAALNHELFFLDLAGNLMTVAMDAGDMLQASKPKKLFRVGTPSGGDLTRYDVTPDAQRILVNEEEGEALTLVQNWPRLLGQ